jgi:putative salt-induced outer membrane protein
MKTAVRNTLVLLSLTSLVALSAFAADEGKRLDGWKNESQAGVVLTSGNTDTSSLNAAEIASYLFSDNLFKLTGGYLYQKSGQVLSGKSWNLGLRYERILSEKVGVFVGESVEGDQFAGVNQRYNSDIGAKYSLVKEDTLNWSAELGYRYTKENLILVSRSLNYARLYTEIEKKFSATVSVKYWIEYLPNFTDSSDWQLNTELSLSAAISSIFSVKSAYLGKYDHEVNAPGLTKLDKTFTTSLVAKF